MEDKRIKLLEYYYIILSKCIVRSHFKIQKAFYIIMSIGNVNRNKNDWCYPYNKLTVYIDV